MQEPERAGIKRVRPRIAFNMCPLPPWLQLQECSRTWSRTGRISSEACDTVSKRLAERERGGRYRRLLYDIEERPRRWNKEGGGFSSGWCRASLTHTHAADTARSSRLGGDQDRTDETDAVCGARALRGGPAETACVDRW